MPMYRKRPVAIEARQLTGDNAEDIAQWCGGSAIDIDGIIIPTTEGDMLAGWGDYVICGVAGEFYPCKPDIFYATYDAILEVGTVEVGT